MIKYSVVLVPFPFDGFSATKVRPAICLTNEIGKFEHIVIAFISSKIPEQQNSSDLVLQEESPLWENTGLHVSSVVRLHKLVAIPKKLIKRRLGTANQHLRHEIKMKLIELFDLHDESFKSSSDPE